MKITQKTDRKQRRIIKKLKHSPSYVYILWILFFFFTPAKKIISLPVKWFQKIFWIISVTTFHFFWYKIGLIDDFIVHKKLRGRWYAQKLFQHAEHEMEKEDVDYMILTSWNKRKASHRFYKKAGMVIVWLWVGVIAYKKIHKK